MPDLSDVRAECVHSSVSPDVLRAGGFEAVASWRQDGSSGVSRAYRVDSYVAVLDFAGAAQPGVASVVRTPEGYLDVDAYIARDGCLTYSDGRESWIEYRPRAELVSAAGTWGVGTPVTDDHPKRMVDATTWVAVARGVHLTEARVEGPLADGRSYLRSRLRISDRALIAKIDAGQRELSIGFSAAVLPLLGGMHPDGTRADAVQTDLLANHTASVKRGRAGPVCAVMMDGAQLACHTSPRFDFAPVSKDRPMPTTAQIAAARAKLDAATRVYLDEIGAPQEMVPVKGPDGVEIMVPSWVAAMLGELVALKQAQTPVMAPPAPAAPNAATGTVPLAPPIAPQVPMMAAVAPPVPAAPDMYSMVEDPEKEKPMDALQVSRTARKRARLERLASAAGVPESSSDPQVVALDAEDEILAREFVQLVIPTAKVDGLRGDALDALVDIAAGIPRPIKPKRGDAIGNPWERPQPRESVLDDVEVQREARRLMAEGC